MSVIRFPISHLMLVMVIILISHSTPVVLAIEKPIWPTDGWVYDTPESRAFDSGILDDMSDYIDTNYNLSYGNQIHTMVIVSQGRVIFDNAFHWLYPSDAEQGLYSITKSVTSTILGIAQSEGYITNLDEPVLQILPDIEIEDMDPRKDDITIRDLLQMRSGLSWNDNLDYSQMTISPDWVEYTFNKDLVAEVNTTFIYNTGGSHTLSAIIQEKVGLSTLDYSYDKIFEPLGIEKPNWPSDIQGITNGGSNLPLSALDLAKIGYLILRDGYWEDNQIVPSEWIKQATTPYSILSNSIASGYGFQWWLYPEYDGFAGLGYNGQILFISPKYDLVVTIFAHTSSQQFYHLSLIPDYILAAYNPDLQMTSSDSTTAPLIGTLSFVIITILHRARKPFFRSM